MTFEKVENIGEIGRRFSPSVVEIGALFRVRVFADSIREKFIVMSREGAAVVIVIIIAVLNVGISVDVLL